MVAASPPSEPIDDLWITIPYKPISPIQKYLTSSFFDQDAIPLLGQDWLIRTIEHPQKTEDGEVVQTLHSERVFLE